MILDISGKITKSFFSTRCCVLCGVGLLVLDVPRLMILDISGKIITKSFSRARCWVLGVVCCVLCKKSIKMLCVVCCVVWVVAGSRDVQRENNKSSFSTF